MESLIGKHWHHLPVDEIQSLLESNPEKGLDVFEVKHRQGEIRGCPLDYWLLLLQQI